MTSTVSPPSHLELDPPSSVAVPARWRRGVWLGAGVLTALAILFLVGYVPKREHKAALAREAAASAAQLSRVVAVSPTPTKADWALVLPGSVEPLETARVHSRASGFVTEWLADIGDRVEAGQLLARLDMPELDREIQQARATLARADAGILQAQATAAYSRSTQERYAALAPEGVISLQELAQYAAQADVDAANIRVASAERGARAADLERLRQLLRFGRIVAPFAGRVSARHVERGALVSGGSSGPLFEIVITDPVRVHVQVPQSLVGDIQPGQSVSVAVNQYPGVVFPGTLTRASGALDPESRTMRVEIQVPNGDGRLLPGMYSTVSASVKRGRRSFLLPATALVQDAAGTRVASVDAEGRVRLVSVDVERDLGAEVEIARGLSGSEAIIRAPGPQIRDGAVVQLSHENGRSP